MEFTFKYVKNSPLVQITQKIYAGDHFKDDPLPYYYNLTATILFSIIILNLITCTEHEI